MRPSPTRVAYRHLTREMNVPSRRRLADRWLESRAVNRTDPGALLGVLTKLVKRDKPEALQAVKNLSRAVTRAWPDREEPEDKPPKHPRLNKEKADSVADFLRWLLVEQNSLDLDREFKAFGVILHAA